MDRRLHHLQTKTFLSVPSVRLTLHSTKLCTKFKIFRKQIFLALRLTLSLFKHFPKIWRSHVFREAHRQNFELVNKTLIFKGHLNVFGARSWLCWAPVDDLTKNVVQQNVWPGTKLSNKTNMISLNPFSCKTQIFKVRVKVSYFFSKLWKSSTIFTGEPWPWRPWTWCSQRVLGGKLWFKKMSTGVAYVLCKKTPHFWAPTMKVRPPDGTSCQDIICSRRQEDEGLRGSLLRIYLVY